MWSLIVFIISLQVLFVTICGQTQFIYPYVCNEWSLEYHYRIKKCSINRWSEPKDLNLMPTCCMMYEFACIKDALFRKHCEVSDKFDDHIKELYLYADAQCLATNNTISLSRAKWHCLKAQTAPIVDEECAKHLPCIHINRGQTKANTISTALPESGRPEHSDSEGAGTERMDSRTTSAPKSTTRGKGIHGMAADESDTPFDDYQSNPSFLIIVIITIAVVLVTVLVCTILINFLMRKRKRKARLQSTVVPKLKVAKPKHQPKPKPKPKPKVKATPIFGPKLSSRPTSTTQTIQISKVKKGTKNEIFKI